MKKYLLIGAALLFAGSSLASAEPGPSVEPASCTTHGGAVVAMLQHGLTEVGHGMLDEHHAFELWASPKGAWLMVSVDQDGSTCIGPQGQGWASPNDPTA